MLRFEKFHVCTDNSEIIYDKKDKKAILIIILAVILAAGCYVLYCAADSGFIFEIPSRLAAYHNKGKISVTIDGEETDLENCEIRYCSDTPDDEPIEIFYIKDNSFKFKEGVYGGNCFTFTLPGYDYIEVCFGIFNANWWHVNTYDINVEIVSNDSSSMTAKIKQMIYRRKSLLYENEETYTFNVGEKTRISAYSGP